MGGYIILKAANVFILTVKTVIRLFLLTNSPYEQDKLVYLLLATQLIHVMQYVSALSLNNNIMYQQTAYLGFLICQFLFYFSLSAVVQITYASAYLHACTIHTQIINLPVLVHSIFTTHLSFLGRYHFKLTDLLIILIWKKELIRKFTVSWKETTYCT
jgi:hypothetical protein